jgi:hypothetical protein
MLSVFWAQYETPPKRMSKSAALKRRPLWLASHPAIVAAG